MYLVYHWAKCFLIRHVPVHHISNSNSFPALRASHTGSPSYSLQILDFMVSSLNHIPECPGNHLRVLLDVSWELAIISVKTEAIGNTLFPYFTLTIWNLSHIPMGDKPNFPQWNSQGSRQATDWVTHTFKLQPGFRVYLGHSLFFWHLPSSEVTQLKNERTLFLNYHFKRAKEIFIYKVGAI